MDVLFISENAYVRTLPKEESDTGTWSHLALLDVDSQVGTLIVLMLKWDVCLCKYLQSFLSSISPKNLYYETDWRSCISDRWRGRGHVDFCIQKWSHVTPSVLTFRIIAWNCLQSWWCFHWRSDETPRVYCIWYFSSRYFFRYFISTQCDPMKRHLHRCMKTQTNRQTDRRQTDKRERHTHRHTHTLMSKLCHARKQRRINNSKIFSINADGSGLVCLTCDDIIEPYSYFSVSFSASGDYYILSSLGPNVPRYDLYRTDDHSRAFSCYLSRFC